MNELVLPPAPNWYLGAILACTPDNTVIYGSRRDIVIIKPTNPSEAADIQIIYSAHNDRVTAVSANNSGWGNPDKQLISAGEDNIVKLWNTETCSLIQLHKGHQNDTDYVIGLSFSGDRVISVNVTGHIIVWRLSTNSVVSMPDIFGQKVKVSCMSSCLHTPWLTAFGLSSGLVVVADLRRTGKLLYKMRSHEAEVTSLSWCPSPFNIFKTNQGLRIENAIKTKSDKGKYANTSTNSGKASSSDVNKSEITKAAMNDSTVQGNKPSEKFPQTSKSSIIDNLLSMQKFLEQQSASSEINESSNKDDILVPKTDESLKSRPVAKEETRPSTSKDGVSMPKVFETKKSDIDKQLNKEDSKSEDNSKSGVINRPTKSSQSQPRQFVYLKVDKSNPWGNVQFNDSDEDENTNDNKTAIEKPNDFLAECQRLLKDISDIPDKTDSSSEVSGNETIVEEDDIFKVDEPVNLTDSDKRVQASVKDLTETIHDLMPSDNDKKNIDLKVDMEVTSTITVDTDEGVSIVKKVDESVLNNMQELKLETEIEHVRSEIDIKDALKNNSEIQNNPATVNVSDESGLSDDMQNLKLKTEIENVPEIKKDFLLASACKEGVVCIWRAGSDGRLQLMLPTTQPNKQSNRSKKLDNKKYRWVSLCWAKPDLLLSSSNWHELISWNLLPDIDTNRRVSKSSVYKSRLIHADHRRPIFAITAPYREYSQDVNADTNWRSDERLNVWTVSQDRWILCTNIGKDRHTCTSYPGMGGTVNCLASSPVDPTRVALGVSDPSVRIWDLSRPHQQVITMSCLWDKIKSRVTTLAWHPIKDNYLAFGTFEGRVGEFDTCNLSKSASIFCNYHRHIVYKIEWGPLPGDDAYGLYSCADGDLIAHSASKPTQEPYKITIEGSRVTTFAWKADFSILAVGLKDGHVKLISKEWQLLQTLYMQKKAIQCLAWHPQSTVAELGESRFSNYLAVTTNEYDVFIYNCDKSEEGQGDASESNKLVAILQGHTLSVKCLAWCPHIPGRLVSGSEDGTAMVWDVNSLTLLSTFRGHSKDNILCVLWSPVDADLIISGGRDCTLRVWRVTKNPPILPEMIKKEKKKTPKTATLDSENNEQTNKAAEVVIQKEEEKVRRNSLMPTVCRWQNTEQDKAIETLWKMLKNLDVSTQKEVKDDKDCSDTSDSEEFQETENVELTPEPAQLFGTRKDVTSLLTFEQSKHMENKRYECAHHIALFKGDLGKNIATAIDTQRLNSWIVSLAPMVSHKLWLEACEAYAVQLAESGHGLQACSYYLAIHKVEKAVEVLCKCEMYREALALAKVRLPDGHPLFNSILEKFTKWATFVGLFELSAQCNIKLGRLSEAGEVLNKRSTVKHLELAAELAKRARNTDLYVAATTKIKQLKANCSAAAAEELKPISESRLEALIAHQKKAEVDDDVILSTESSDSGI